MSASIFETDAVLTVCGIKSPLSLTVRYLSLLSYPGDREQPEEPRSVEITEVLINGIKVDKDQFSEEQLQAIAEVILSNQ